MNTNQNINQTEGAKMKQLFVDYPEGTFKDFDGDSDELYDCKESIRALDSHLVGSGAGNTNTFLNFNGDSYDFKPDTDETRVLNTLKEMQAIDSRIKYEIKEGK